MSQFNFSDHITEYLGYEYDDYIQVAKARAIRDPEKYAEQRRKATQALRSAMIKDMYKKIRDFMVDGMVPNGTGKDDVESVFKDATIKPNYPDQLCNEYAVAICRKLGSEINEIILKVFPQAYDKAADTSMVQRAAGSIVAKMEE